MLLTYNVTFDSEVDGKRIDEVTWPINCLVTNIKRGENSFAPQWYHRIKAGDYLTVMINEEELDFMNELITEMCCVKEKSFIE